MKYFGTELSEKHKELTKLIRAKNMADKARELFQDIHAGLHLSEVSGSGPNRKERLNVSITDTGNALSDEEIIRLSKEINIRELLVYRNAVGQRTRSIISGFTNADLLRKVSQQDLEKIK